MSHCESGSSSGRHRAIFLTPEDADPKTSKEKEPPDADPAEDDAPAGLIKADGSINWNCPCLGGMAVGPCGVEFRSAFECFHYSESEIKGSECLDKFMEMQECMKQHPDLYDEKDKDPAEEGEAAAFMPPAGAEEGASAAGADSSGAPAAAPAGGDEDRDREAVKEGEHRQQQQKQ